MSISKAFQTSTILSLAISLGGWSLVGQGQTLDDVESVPLPGEQNSGFEEVVLGDSFPQDSWENLQAAYPTCGRCGECEHCRRGWFNLILCDTWPRWTVQVDALLLWRGNIPSQPLFRLIGPDTVALDTNSLQTPATGGPRFGLFLHLDDCYAIEGNYFLVDGFNGEKTLPPGDYYFEDIAGIVPSGQLIRSDVATATSGGKIQSAEMNWRRRADLVTWLAGFRWVQWNESLNITSREGTNLNDTIDVGVGNDLYGGQAGCDLRVYELGQWLRVNALGKAGIFYNPAHQMTSVNSPENIQFAGSSQAEQTAFFGEFGVNATVQIRQWLGWRVGYSLFWLSGVATAAEQLSVVNAQARTSGINTNGSVLLQGVTTGIEARW